MAPRKPKPTIETWVNSMIYGMRDQHGPVHEFRLVHIGPGGSNSDIIETIAVSAEPGESAHISIAETVRSAAETDAAAIGKTQKYGILAMFEGDEGVKQLGRFLFVQSAGDGEENNIGETEPPNSIGLVSQAQRHTEGIMRMHLAGTQTAFSQQTQIIDRLGSMVTTLMESHQQNLETVTKLMNDKDERDSKRAESDFVIEMKRKAADRFFPMAQLLLGKMMGAKMLPSGDGDGTKNLTTIIRDFLKTIDSEQLSKISDVLSDEQKVILYALFEEAMKEDTATSTAEQGTVKQ